jgi:hypothetical protein
MALTEPCTAYVATWRSLVSPHHTASASALPPTRTAEAATSHPHVEGRRLCMGSERRKGLLKPDGLPPCKRGSAV